MQVHVKFNIGTREEGVPALTEGEHDVDEATGAELVRRGFAEVIEAPTKEPLKAPEKTPDIKAVPPKKKADK
jgi:hypothetical protein